MEELKDFPSSARALRVGVIDRRWETLEIARSFVISCDEMELSNLRNKAWRMGKKLNKRFRVIDHKKDGYEVARVE